MDLTASDLAQLDLQLEDVGAPLTAVEDGLKLLGGSQAGLHTDLGAIVHQGAERLVHHDLVERHRRERSGDALDEVDLILASPALRISRSGVSGLCTGKCLVVWVLTESTVTRSPSSSALSAASARTIMA